MVCWGIFYNASFQIFKTSFCGFIYWILMLFYVKYVLTNFREPNQYTISFDLLSKRISIRISKQSKQGSTSKGIKGIVIKLYQKVWLPPLHLMWCGWAKWSVGLLCMSVIKVLEKNKSVSLKMTRNFSSISTRVSC